MASGGNATTDILFPSTAVTVRNPAAHLRKLKQTVGHRIAHKRLLSCSSSTSTLCQSNTTQSRHHHSVNNNEENAQQPLLLHNNANNDSLSFKPPTTAASKPIRKDAPLAYRRPRNLFYSASRGYYYACTFLGDQDNIVLCIDHCGIDAIRLNNNSHGNNNGSSDIGGKQHETLGRAVATGIHASSSSSSSAASAQQQQQTLLNTTSILGGQAFVTGLPSGEYRVFATEHASTWGNQHNLQSLKVSQRQQQPQQQPLSSSATTTTTTYDNHSSNTGNTSRPYSFTTAWSAPGPQRRYKPDSVATLLRQVRNPSAVFTRPMEEIHGWNNHQHHHHQDTTYGISSDDLSCGYNHPSESVCHWDFRETPSSLLALHVGKYQDNVGLRVLDNRACQNSRNQVGILVDDMPQVSACCFVTDTIIATAAQQSCGAESSTTTTAPEQCIRLWDLRKMTKPAASASKTSSSNTNPLMCPSFPREVVHTLDPFQEPIHLQQDEEEQEVSSLVSSSSGDGEMRRIVDLKSDHNGRLLVTTTEDIKNSNNLLVRRTMQTHWSVDLTRGETIPVTRPYQIDTTCSNNNSLAASSSFAYDQSCSVVANFEAGGSNTTTSRGGGQPIVLYDIANAEKSHEEQQQQQSQQGRRKKKRSRRRRDNDKSLPKPIGHIDAHVKDEYGLDSKLVSIAMNAAGTAVVGVSRDSDLYWWSA